MPSLRKRRLKVSVWAGQHRYDGPGKDVLTDLCGVDGYDIDAQEVEVDDEAWRRRPVAALLAPLSYAQSFLPAAVAAAERLGIKKALYVLVQYDCAYDPTKSKRKVAPDPAFLGVFDYDDEGEGQWDRDD